MLSENLKDAAVKSMTGLSGVALKGNQSATLHSHQRQWLQSCLMSLMAGIMLSVCMTGYSATEHDATAHETSNPASTVQGAHKQENADKVYPSRAVQGVSEPLPPGAKLHKMILSHHELEPWTFVPKRKDRIEITNTSNLTHALYVTYPDGTVVNLEIQIPGDVVTWNVPDDADGEYLFRCWVHPVIRAKMLIEE